MTTRTSKVKAPAGAVEVTEPAKKGWSTKLGHPSYVIEPCPNCNFPESDGGYCPECGYTRYRHDCPHCKGA